MQDQTLLQMINRVRSIKVPAALVHCWHVSLRVTIAATEQLSANGLQIMPQDL